MKLLNIICILFSTISAFKIPNVGLSAESYLELTRKYPYLRLMKSLPLHTRKILIQKIKNEKTAKLRAGIAKAMQADREMPAGQASKGNAGVMRNKVRSRMNRFRNFHN